MKNKFKGLDLVEKVPEELCKFATLYRSSVKFSSVIQSCPTLCGPMNCSMPGLPIHHQHPEFTQTHVHRVSDAIIDDKVDSKRITEAGTLFEEQ